MWPLQNKRKSEGFSYISAEKLNRRAITIFIIEAGIILALIVGVVFMLAYFHIITLFPAKTPSTNLSNNEKVNVTAPKTAQRSASQTNGKNANVRIIPKDEAKMKSLELSLGYTILWMDKSDTNGRTILYTNNKNTTAPQLVGGRLNGIGEISDSSSTSLPKYIVGSFVKFEPIEGSKDKYLVFKNPITTQLLPKIHVVISSEGTRVLVEDDNYGPKKPIPDYKAAAEQLGFLSSYITDPSLFKENDAVAVLLNSRLSLKNNYVATTLIVRRFGGKIEFLSGR